MKTSTRVWDLPVRVGHWLLAAAFLGAWLTGEAEAWRVVHAVCGGAVLGVVSFRLIWGFVGTQPARFADFVRGPRAAAAYLKSLFRLAPLHYAGHNPAGAWAILALLALGLLAGVSGWLNYQDLAGDWMAAVHEFFANFMLLVVLLHLAGVAAGSLIHRENLPRAMVTGMKQSNDAVLAPVRPRPLAAVLLLAWVAAVAWWAAQ